MNTASCLLIDRQTGRTFTGRAPSAVIGRERSQADVVLRDGDLITVGLVNLEFRENPR